ncbi:hypothetical protein [Catellatospora methionotrophica]|uniref:hypothetical protein n=1 Tax=Catellatospora methionotrophica TaxID=121620 RepID=UPI0033E5EA08
MDPADVVVAQRQLAAVSCDTLFVDLAGVTFGGAALIHYLYALSARLPGAAISLCGAKDTTTQIIKLSGLDRVADVLDTVPHDWASAPPAPSTSPQRPMAGHPVIGKPQPAT